MSNTEDTKVSIKVLKKLDKMALDLVMDGINPDFGSKYHKLNTLLAELRPKMKEAGLILSQLNLGVREGSVVVRTIVADADSDEYTQFDTLFPAAPGLTPYEIGSLVTYAQVYALRGLLSRSGSADDNGRAANRGTLRTQEEAKTSTPVKEVPVGQAKTKGLLSGLSVKKEEDSVTENNQTTAPSLFQRIADSTAKGSGKEQTANKPVSQNEVKKELLFGKKSA